ncbi:DNA-binding response regulator, NarL/FixJ family, contains REC and HTH domains [Parapedobacter composti]|uniref:DNA-binding response regulator, NarL/FixJ family, contains REC and HTH domains n=1 Tax=Parapedobacter composti TaxID=623281 RepID=A0A1I1GWD9_9SPHI|nr:response regulator transcription factor [Parapedobacter composti]SFC15994.1 DNA-binding response regulator, NarL/FixJ family, contains REC and HTH domains [Parapedobacter composti]
MTEVLIADDHGIVRLGTSIVIKEALPLANITQAGDVDELIRFLSEKQYDLLLLDINMPGGNNITMVEKVLAVQPGIKILVFSSYDETLYALRYLQAGASGYLSKNASKTELKNAILAVVQRGKYMSPEIQELYYHTLTMGKSFIAADNPLNKLSNREVDVAKYLVQGMGIQDVSKTLNLSTSTVSTYKTRIFEKLQVNNLVELIEKFRLYSGS